MPEKQKKKNLSQEEQLQRHKQEKKRKKQLKEQAQKLKKIKQQQEIADEKVKLIYQTGLAEAYKYFVTEAFRQDVKFNIFEYAAQKMLKFEKLRKQKNKKILEINKSLDKNQIENKQSEQIISQQKKPNQKKNNVSPQKKKTVALIKK